MNRSMYKKTSINFSALRVITAIALASIWACQSKVDVSARYGSAPTVSKSVTGKTSLGESTVVQNEGGKITIPASAFTVEASVTLSAMTKTAFLEAVGLPSTTIIPAGPLQASSVQFGTATAVEPQSPLTVRLYLPADQTVSDDTAAVIIVTAADGTTKTYFIAHDRLSFLTDATTGLVYTEIAKIVSGNFAVALVSGVSKATLEEKYTTFPVDGVVNSTGGGSSVVAAVPTHAAAGVSFTDTDSDGSEIAGTFQITAASNESDVTHYVLYWGSGASVKQSQTPIVTIAANGTNRSYTFSSDTTIPTSPQATHLLVYTKNATGEMATGVSYLIVDLGVPIHTATSLTLTDTDNDLGELGGTVTIVKSADESDVTDYVLYWGSNATTKQNATPIATVSVTGSNVTYNLPANTAIPTGPAATHLLVFTKNVDGEMATGVSFAIVDTGVPVHLAAGVSFTDSDTDAGEIAGTVTITKAADESDVTDYVLYWGSNATTKQNATAITTIAKTGANVTYNFGANTAIPTGPAATHLLVYTKNAIGEMATNYALAISDSGALSSITAYPTVATNVNATLAWANTGNALAVDGSYATVTNSGGAGVTSDILQFSGYDFSAIPVGATISGFVVGINEHAVFSNSVSDHTVSMLKAGSIVGSPVTDPAYWPGSTTLVNRGSNSNLWGTTWTVSDVLDANFGVAVRVVFAGNSGAYIDAVRITVYYTP